MLAVSYLFLKGTPFVYQGQEIGMTNWYPDKTSLYEDVQTRNQHPDWPEEKRLALYHRASRDSARTPGAVDRQGKRRVHNGDAVVLCQ